MHKICLYYFSFWDGAKRRFILDHRDPQNRPRVLRGDLIEPKEIPREGEYPVWEQNHL